MTNICFIERERKGYFFKNSIFIENSYFNVGRTHCESFKKEGNQIQFRDTGQAVRLFIVEQFGLYVHYLDGEILKFIDALANNGVNGFRVFGLVCPVSDANKNHIFAPEMTLT